MGVSENYKELKALLARLGSIRGRHTELVTVYVPAGYELNKIAEQVRQEQSTAQNIKSKAVRKNVLSALERILQHLKLFKETPPHGMVLFAGNVAEKEGVADIEIWSLEPPEPIRQKLYWCGQTFILDPLQELVREKEIYGLIVIDKSEATIGLLKGKKIEVLKHLESIVPGKTKAGGWSQARYARIREGLLNDFLKKAGDVASSQFMGTRDLRGIIVGGPGPIKEQFVEGEYLHYEIKKKMVGTVNTSYTGEIGLRETVERAETLLTEASVMREKQVLDRFFEEFAKDSGRAVYGIHQVIEALAAGNIELLLVSEDFDWVRVRLASACGKTKEGLLRHSQISQQVCMQCGQPFEEREEEDILEEITKKAEEIGARVEMISTDTQKGEQLRELGGIAGLLRYKV